MRNQLSFDSSPRIFKQTEKFILKINHLDPQTSNPQKLLLYLLSHDFSSEQCYDITQSRYQKEKLESQITFLRNKISGIIKSNQKIIHLLQQRDEKAILIEQLLSQRNHIQVHIGIEALRTKHKTKDVQLQGIKSMIPDKRTTIKDNLRYYRLMNRQLRQKIKQLKIECQKKQKENKIRFEQQEIQQKLNSINDKMSQRTTLVMQQNSQSFNHRPLDNSQSDVWIQRIEGIKRKYLKPQDQYEKIQIYQQAKKIHESPVKRYISPQNTHSIYSDRFWYNNLRDYRYKQKQNLTRSISPKFSQQRRSIYGCKSRERISLNQEKCTESSLSRVKSHGSLNTSCKSNIYSYRKIYR